MDNICSFHPCGRKVAHKGLCQTHYTQQRVGKPLTVIAEKRASRTKEVGVWYPDLDDNYSGYVRLVRRNPDGTLTRRAEHRVVMEDHLGRSLLRTENIHHINGDKSDNRLSNLELWSTAQPSGQSVDAKVRWAKELLLQYEPTALACSVEVS
jgi:hypothetical protein